MVTEIVYSVRFHWLCMGQKCFMPRSESCWCHSYETMQTNSECTSLEDHILKMQYTWTWGTQVELYAAASLFQKEIYVFTPTLRKYGTYTWIKIPPYPPQVELVFPPQDKPWLRLLNEINHMELCHTFGNHYDVVQSTDGFTLFWNPHLASEILEFENLL